MKKDRNCGATPMPTPYPMMGGYGMQAQVMPMGYGNPPMPGFQGMPMQGYQSIPMQGFQGIPNQSGSTLNVSNVNDGSGMYQNQMTSVFDQMQAQINNLDRRVSRLETMIQDTKSTSISGNKYTNSNYHMM